MAKIRHIAFFTEDPDRLARFYVEVFGMRITQETKPSAESGRAIFITDGYIDVALIQPFNTNAPKGINHFGFTLEDGEERSAVLGKLKELGIEPIVPPADRPYIEDAVRDVDGNKIDLSTTGLRPQGRPRRTDKINA